NNGGLFEKWYTSRGFKKRNVYNYIQIYNEVQNLHGDDLEVFEKLPKSLQIETSKKSADPELKQKVLDGDITTNKQYKDMLKEKEQAKRRAQQAETQTQAEQKERERLERENEELANREPKVKEVIKEVDNTDHERIRFLEEKIKRMQANDQDVSAKEKEVKLLKLDANKSVLKTKISIDEFLQEVAFTSYRRGAIASSSDSTKNKLREGIDDLKNFIKEMELALDGTIEYQ